MFQEDRSSGAFETLVGRYAGLVYHTCAHVIRDQHEAEDAAQAVFIVLFRRPPARPPTSLAGWLYMVARKTSAKVLRDRAARARREAAAAAQVGARTDRPEADLAEALHAALNRVPAAEREVLILRYLQERSVRDVAAALDCSVATVSERAAKGLSRMARVLSATGPAVTVPAVSAGLVALGGACAAAAPVASSGVLVPASWSPQAVALADAVELRMWVAKIVAWAFPSAVLAAALGVAAVGLSPRPPAAPPSEPERPAGDAGVAAGAGPVAERVAIGTAGPVAGFAVSADGRRIAVLHENRALAYYETASGVRLGDVVVELRSREKNNPRVLRGPRSVALTVGPAGARVAAPESDWEWYLHLIDPVTGRDDGLPMPAGLPPASAIAFGPGGRTLVAARTTASAADPDRTKGIEVRRLSDGKLVWGRAVPLRSVAVAASAPLLAVGTTAGGVEVLDAETGAVRRSWPAAGGPVVAVGISPDGRRVAASDGGTVRVYRADADGPVETRPAGRERCRAVALDADALTAVYETRAVRVRAGAEREVPLPRASRLSLSADGRVVALLGAGGELTVHALADPKN
ncbi:sigma-70 family RNA polymerase sigma factor [Gemmata sp.]|uniref:sigma-70 family RNA polymerase sigma factor n=1 Tax=Gemmata sp. TaxID=1914242 RepID=UPI003F6EEDA5